MTRVMGRTMVAKYPLKNERQKTRWKVIQERAVCHDTSDASLLPGSGCKDKPSSFQQFRVSLLGGSPTNKLLTKPFFAG